MAEQKHKLFLLDAMALIFRAHFAFSKNPRINSKGMNTGAAFGFTNSLLDILLNQNPSHIGVATDMKGPTFRHKEFPEYKANRDAPPEEIEENIPYIFRIIKAFNIPLFGVEGFEADDLIGTLALRAPKEFEVYMMTSDKDYSQLVTDNVYLYKPAFMGRGVDILGVPEVLSKWNIQRIDQVTDILGLQGDSVDNIPGVPGVGEKTAQKLISEYDTVENLVEHADEIAGKLGEKLRDNKELAILSKSLATINIESPVNFDEKELLRKEPNKEELQKIFEELEFRTIAKRVLGESAPAPTGTPKKDRKDENQLGIFQTEEAQEEEDEPTGLKNADTVIHDYRAVTDPKDIEALGKYLLLQKEFAFDTETTSINPIDAEMVGISFSYIPGEAYYIPVPKDAKGVKEILEPLLPALRNREITKIGQNIKYDILILKNYGIEVEGPLYDTMVAHFLIQPETRHNMDALAERYLKYQPISITELIGSKSSSQGSMRDVELGKIKEYASEDADITLQLKQKIDSHLSGELLKKLFTDVEMPLIQVLADMETYGVGLDVEALGELSKELEKEALELQTRIHKEAGEEFNINSPKQMGDILFGKMNILKDPKKTKTGQYATGEEVLIRLAPQHKIVEDILSFREVQKLKSTYVDALPQLISPKDHKIHTSFNQTIAATGRLSSTNPNLQNIPIRTARGREIRKAFVPSSKDFLIMSADYSQIELRIMAEFSGDDTMLKSFSEGLDIHAMTASKINQIKIEDVTEEMRRRAKVANFGIIYGISAFGLSQRLNIPRKEAAELIDQYFKQFPLVKKYMDDSIAKAREKEFVETILGRRRSLPEINSRNQAQRGFAERNAINAPIQGSAADLIKVAMINIHDWMKKEKLRSRMILQVHDELVFDMHKEEEEILIRKVSELMSNALPLKVPLDVGTGTGKNWLEAH